MDKLEKELMDIESKLGGSGSTPADVEDKLQWHLDYIESLIEQGGGGGGSEDITSKINFKYELEENYVYLVISGPIGKAIHHLSFEDGSDWCFLDLVSEAGSSLNLLTYKTSISYYNFIDYEVNDDKNEIKIPYNEAQYWDEYKDVDANERFNILGASWFNYKGLLTQTGGK